MKNLLLAGLFLIVGMVAKAGPITSGGGDAVVCYADPLRITIVSVQMFDHWEQDQVLHYSGGVDLGGPGLSIQDKIILATDRINNFDTDLASYIKTVALSLADNSSTFLVTAATLPEIDDAHPLVLPNLPNCYVEQFAVQYKDLVSGQRRFAIADKFYSHAATSNDTKAGLLLHEAIYRYAISKGSVTNSDGVRYFNYAISTTKLNSGYANDYHQYIINANLNFNGCTFNNIKVNAMTHATVASTKYTNGIENTYTSCYKKNQLQIGSNYTLKFDDQSTIAENVLAYGHNKEFVLYKAFHYPNISEPEVTVVNATGTPIVNNLKAVAVQVSDSDVQITAVDWTTTDLSISPSFSSSPVECYNGTGIHSREISFNLSNQEVTECPTRALAFNYTLLGVNYTANATKMKKNIAANTTTITMYKAKPDATGHTSAAEFQKQYFHFKIPTLTRVYEFRILTGGTNLPDLEVEVDSSFIWLNPPSLDLLNVNLDIPVSSGLICNVRSLHLYDGKIECQAGTATDMTSQKILMDSYTSKNPYIVSNLPAGEYYGDSSEAVSKADYLCKSISPNLSAYRYRNKEVYVATDSYTDLKNGNAVYVADRFAHVLSYLYCSLNIYFVP